MKNLRWARSGLSLLAIPLIVAVVSIAIASNGASAQTGGGANTVKIVAAANAFLATLSDTEKSSALFDWSNTAQKQKWSNLPQGAFQRAGIMWGNMSATQQTAWLAVMQATLSTEGYNRVLAEWHADDALAAQGVAAGLHSAPNTTTSP